MGFHVCLVAGLLPATGSPEELDQVLLFLRTAARGAAAHALQTGPITNHHELLAFRAKIAFIALLPGLLTDGGHGQRLPLELQLMGHAAVPVPMAMSVPMQPVPPHRQVFGQD